MKKIFLAALAACAIFASCTKENESASTQGDNVLVVKLPDNVITRAVEDQIADQAQATISNAEVFLINSGSGAVVDRKTFVETTAGSKTMRIEDVSSTVNKVVVVANIPSDELSAVQALTTYSTVKAYAFSIANQNAGLGGINDKTLMGEDTPVTASDPDAASHVGHDYKEVTIALDALTARFEIGAVDKGTGIESVELLGVWINNFYADGSKAAVTTYSNTSTYWDTNPSTVTGSPSATEFTTVTFAGSPAGDAYSPISYYNAANNAVKLDAASQVYAFHVFAGANIPHVIMLVKGEYADGYYVKEDGEERSNDKKYFLGWVTFTNYLDGGTAITSIDPNTIYKIGVGTTGVKINAKDITEEPELKKFDLGIACTITKWTKKDVTPSVD